MLRNLKDRGLWDDRPLITEIREHKFAALAFGSKVLSDELEWRGRKCLWPDLRHVIAANYSLVAAVGPPYVMVPKGSGHAQPFAH